MFNYIPTYLHQTEPLCPQRIVYFDTLSVVCDCLELLRNQVPIVGLDFNAQTFDFSGFTKWAKFEMTYKYLCKLLKTFLYEICFWLKCFCYDFEDNAPLKKTRVNWHFPFKLRTKNKYFAEPPIKKFPNYSLDTCMWVGDDGIFQYFPSGKPESSNIYPSSMTENMLKYFPVSEIFFLSCWWEYPTSEPENTKIQCMYFNCNFFGN